jgi:2-dehydropantoate 2-reductase
VKVCIVGAGAVGGLIGGRLGAASALARGATLEALRTYGWRVQGASSADAPVDASDDPAELGGHDVVIIAVKAHALPALAPSLKPLIGPDTVVVPALNGVPWWFFDGLGGPYDGLRLTAVDPVGAIAAAIPTGQVIGCVVHLSASTPQPGLVEHRSGNGLIVGEPSGARGERLAQVAALLRGGGFEVTESDRVQNAIWYKLWGNMTVNPISALTGATADRILDDELVNAFMRAVMGEAQAIGERIGCAITETAADRNAVTRRLGAFRTSMLQDAEAGRPLELDGMVTVVREIGAATGVATPNLDALLGLTRLWARSRDLY